METIIIIAITTTVPATVTDIGIIGTLAPPGNFTNN